MKRINSTTASSVFFWILNIRWYSRFGLRLALGLMGCLIAGRHVPLSAQSTAALASVLELASIEGDEALPAEMEFEGGGPEALPVAPGFRQVVPTREKIGRRWVTVQPQDEVWLVSARDFRRPCDCSRLQCCRLVCGRWRQAELSELTTAHQEDLSRVTLVYVHGNRTNLEYAKSRGLQLYENMFAGKFAPCRPPVRLVLFAWKSESEYHGIVRDFHAKSDRSYDLAPVFAGFLNQFQDRRMVVSGFSLGGQVVIGGVAQACLEQEKPGRFEVAMITPSLNGAFACCELGQIPSINEIKQTTVFVNRNDAAIRIADRLNRNRCPESRWTMDDIAFQSQEMGTNSIRIVDITCEVTCKHSVINYSADSEALRNEMVEIIQRVFSTIQR